MNEECLQHLSSSLPLISSSGSITPDILIYEQLPARALSLPSILLGENSLCQIGSFLCFNDCPKLQDEIEQTLDFSSL